MDNLTIEDLTTEDERKAIIAHTDGMIELQRIDTAMVPLLKMANLYLLYQFIFSG